MNKEDAVLSDGDIFDKLIDILTNNMLQLLDTFVVYFEVFAYFVVWVIWVQRNPAIDDLQLILFEKLANFSLFLLTF